MKIPREVKIGWKKYSIVSASEALNSGGALYGQIDYDRQTITLRETNTGEQDEETLIHEVLHGISDMYGMGMTEDLVARLSNALYTFLKDNNLSLNKEEISNGKTGFDASM